MVVLLAKLLANLFVIRGNRPNEEGRSRYYERLQ